MTVIEVIKEFKLPQKVLAEKLNMNYTTFRKKMNGAGNKFSDEDLRQLSVAVFDYVEELNKNVQKHLQKVD